MITFVVIPVHCFLLLTLELLRRIVNIQTFHITSRSGLQIHQNVSYERGIVPKLKRVEEGLKGNGTCLAQLARLQQDFLGRIEHKGGTMNEKIGPYKPAHIIFIQLRVFENGALSWRTNGRSKVLTSANILPPTQKGLKLQNRPLKVPKNFHKVSPSSKLLLQPAQRGKHPDICFGWTANRRKGWFGRNCLKWICIAALIDVHLCVSFFSKVVLIT